MSRHNAPPVVYPVQRSSVLGWLLLACWGMGLGVLASWVLVSPVWDWRAAGALLAATGTSVAALVSWYTSRSGQLAWDGERWHWDSPGDFSSSEQSQVAVIVDVQSALLLLFETVGGARHWLWVERASQSERWMDLRRAVYSPHRVSTHSAESGSSSPPHVEKLNP